MSPVTFPQSRQHLLQGSNKLEKDAVTWDKSKVLKNADNGTDPTELIMLFGTYRV